MNRLMPYKLQKEQIWRQKEAKPAFMSNSGHSG